MSVEIKNLADYGMKGLAWGAGFSTVILLSSLLIQTMQPGPSIQLVENKKQETKTVCTEKDIDWQPAYPKGQWQTFPRQVKNQFKPHTSNTPYDIIATIIAVLALGFVLWAVSTGRMPRP